MNFYKYVLAATIAISGVFTSCSSDDDYTPGKPAGSNNVTFICDGTVVLAQTATNFEVSLIRDNASSALEIPLTVVGSEGFTVPASASFPSGEDTITVTVGVPADMAVNKGYNFEIRIPEEFTNPYKKQDTYPTFKATIMKEDYAPYAIATYEDGWYEEAWEIEIEYSPSQALYRVKDIVEVGYPLFFTINKDTNVVKLSESNGAATTSWVTGIIHPTYGMVTAKMASGEYVNDPENGDYIVFPFQWTVSAGSFGTYPSYIYDIELL